MESEQPADGERRAVAEDDVLGVGGSIVRPVERHVAVDVVPAVTTAEIVGAGAAHVGCDDGGVGCRLLVAVGIDVGNVGNCLRPRRLRCEQDECEGSDESADVVYHNNINNV